MKPKRLLFSALMLFAVLNSASAQIEQEIKSFVDSTEILVNNGRRMMLQSVQARDIERVAEIFEFLNERTRAYHCDAFTFQEELSIVLLTGNWDEFLIRAEHFSEVGRTPLCVPLRDRLLIQALHTQLHQDALWLSNNVLIADLTSEEKALLELYFYLVENGADETYNQKIRAFRRNYPNSRFNDFITGWLPRVPPRVGFGFSFGAMQIFPTGGLANYFSSATLPSMSFDLQVNNFYFGFQFSGDVGIRLNAPLLSSETGYNRDFLKGDRLRYIHFEFPVGYTVFRNNRFELLPFVSLGGTTIRSNLYTGENNWRSREFFIVDSFSVTPGLRTEFNLVGFTMRDAWGTAVPSSLRLRLDVGYNIPVSYRFTPARGNIPYARLALVWWFGN